MSAIRHFDIKCSYPDSVIGTAFDFSALNQKSNSNESFILPFFPIAVSMYAVLAITKH
jgi:hypothetical protein